MPTQKEILAAHREQLDAAWHVRWPSGQWTFIHGAGRVWVAHQTRRSTSHTRYRARNAVYYIGGEFFDSDWVYYPTRWYEKPCRVEHHLSKALLIARLERAHVPVGIIERVQAWEAE